jgi:geranylgeranyl diphosphate synthase type I
MSVLISMGTQPKAPAPELFGWARDMVAPALADALRNLPAPERRIAGYHRGLHAADGGPPEPGTERGGKAVRPALAFLASRAVGGTAEAAVPAAVVVELIHDFSLLHDDVIDGDPLRRHRPAAWTVYGVPAAVLTGDALLVNAIRLLSDSSADRIEPALHELLTALVDLMRGQSQDVAFEKALHVRAAEYLAMAEGKTGALMGCACALGGVLAGASPDRVAGLRDFGRRLGVAFQCIDDLLGLWGSSARSGKPVGADVSARKKSLPVVVALADDGPAGRRLADLYSGSAPLREAEVVLATKLIEEAGGREETEREAKRQLAAAMRALARAEPVPEVYRQFHDIALMVTRREN